MRIINANIVLENKVVKGYVEFDQNKIIKVESGKSKQAGYDAKGLYLLPTFFDSHTHGGYGVDFNSWNKQNIKKYFDNINYEGVGSVAMTTITCSFNDLKKLADKYKDIKALDKNNVIKGWYIEGPFISPEKKGAHPIKLIKPINLEILNYIKKTLPKVTKILAVAPENANNIKYISQLLKDYFISIGHSNANYATAEKAFNLGARRIVHLYNAMAGFNHRVPTLLNAIFNNDQVSCELICDFIHVAKEVIMNTYRIIGSERIMLISDSLSSKGLKDGTYNIWNTNVFKKGMINYLKNTKTIAGSAMPFNQIVKNYGTLTKCSMQEILKVSSLNAARSLKLDKQIGTISPNANSSFVLIDKQYNLKHVFINGKKIK